jgi:hypothetical protein
MKKLFFTCVALGAALMCNVFSANAQYDKNDKMLNIGIGVNSYYGQGIPLGASLEVGITDDISAGGEFDFNSGNLGSTAWGYNAFYIGARGSYHLNNILNLNNDKLDVYAGLGLGYRSFKWKDDTYGFGYNYNSGLNLNYLAGGRYAFNEKLGGFVELGYVGLSNAKVGISLKF